MFKYLHRTIGSKTSTSNIKVLSKYLLLEWQLRRWTEACKSGDFESRSRNLQTWC